MIKKIWSILLVWFRVIIHDIDYISELKGWEYGETIERTRENAQVVLSVLDNQTF